METLKTHWTARSVEDFQYRVAADFILQVEKAMEKLGINQTQLAHRLGVTEGRISQILNNPGNLTLRKIVEYASALRHKVSIIEYDDGDYDNLNGPVNSEIFVTCWERMGRPTDFFSLESCGGISNSMHTSITSVTCIAGSAVLGPNSYSTMGTSNQVLSTTGPVSGTTYPTIFTFGNANDRGFSNTESLSAWIGPFLYSAQHGHHNVPILARDFGTMTSIYQAGIGSAAELCQIENMYLEHEGGIITPAN